MELAGMNSFGGSFGLVVGSVVSADIFGKSLVGDAIEEFTRLLATRGNESLLRSSLTPRVAVKYRDLFTRLAARLSGLGLQWGSVNSARSFQIEFSAREVLRLAQTLSRTNDTIVRDFRVTGQLVGANLRTRRYELQDNEHGAKYSGRASPDARRKLMRATLGAVYVATLREIIEEHILTGEQATRYELIDLGQI
jgi:hypothetical protein